MQFIVGFCFLSNGDNISIIVRHDATFIIAVMTKKHDFLVGNFNTQWTIFRVVRRLARWTFNFVTTTI